MVAFVFKIIGGDLMGGMRIFVSHVNMRILMAPILDCDLRVKFSLTL